MAQVEQNSPNYYKIDEKVKKEEKKIFENFFAKIVRVKILTKKKCPKVLEKVVPARNSMSSIDWCKNFHETKQHDDFYKRRTDRRTDKKMRH